MASPDTDNNIATMCVIGQTIRVRLGLDSSSRHCRATILTLNEGCPHTVDVLFQDGMDWAEGKEEEAQVPLYRLFGLEPFEEGSDAERVAIGKVGGTGAEERRERAQRLREQGNQLFTKYKDYGAALEFYSEALEIVGPREGKGGLRVGTLMLNLSWGRHIV